MPAHDQALEHPAAFAVMALLLIAYCAVQIARRIEPVVRPASFINSWVGAYIVVQGVLMSFTTAVALFFVIWR